MSTKSPYSQPPYTITPEILNRVAAISEATVRLYEEATESAKQSRNLLNQAKSRVEQLIEEAVRA